MYAVISKNIRLRLSRYNQADSLVREVLFLLPSLPLWELRERGALLRFALPLNSGLVDGGITSALESAVFRKRDSPSFCGLEKLFRGKYYVLLCCRQSFLSPFITGAPSRVNCQQVVLVSHGHC